MALRYAALADRICVEVRGEDAGAFLHGQLTHTILGLGPDAAPLAAWADSRGRVRALFRVVREPERWLLVTPRAGGEAIRNKLSLYVLRSKVTLAEASDVAVAALLGDPSTLEPLMLPADASANRALRRELCFIKVSDTYWQVLGAKEALDRLRAQIEGATEDEAARTEIALGLPELTPETTERFVAQALNLEALGAVSFNKGCYPGQEVIARVHNLGGVKRHARRYSVPGEPPARGAAVLAADQAHVGDVVRTARANTGTELLAVVDDAAATGALSCNGGPLTELPLPFVVPGY